VTPSRSHSLPDVSPQLATAQKAPPAGAGWLHEIKYDGYRLLCRIEEGRVRLISRNGNDWSDHFPSVVAGALRLGVDRTIMDGEVAVALPNGRTSFQLLQNALGGQPRTGLLRFFVFDLLYLDGVDWMDRPLIERKQKLSEVLGEAPPDPILYCDHVVGRGAAFLKAACTMELEGIISKRTDAKYCPGRGRDWIKVKCHANEEFVVGGYTEPGGSRHGFGALLVGAHDESGRLRFTGRVGTGFSDVQLTAMAETLKSIERPGSPFVDGPSGRAAKDMHWVDPTLVVQVEYAELTHEGLLRHPSFQGIREDRDPADVVLPAGDSRRTAAQGDGEQDDRSSPSPALVSVAPDVLHSSAPLPQDVSPVARRPGGVPGGTRASGRRAKAPAEIGGIAVTNPGKVMYPEAGVTKRDLAEYYEAVAEYMLPCVADRPLTLVRCPNGIRDCFYQKHIEGALPDAIRKIPIRENEAEAEYAIIDSAAGLIALAQLGVLEIHTWGSKRGDLEHPDKFTMDFDPDPGVAWVRVVEAALEVRGLLGELGLESFLKTTGGKGLHVVVPIEPDLPWDGIKEFSRRIADRVAKENPGKYTLNISKKQRKGRILIDYLRNGRGATAIEAWSTRAREGAPVAVPIRWEELADGVRSDTFTVGTIGDRLASMTDDPWAGFDDARRPITRKMLREIGLVD
jgi:bifunctional non-homologous end joining protein LigD